MLENLAANWPYLLLMGLTAGFTSALLGIGGGVIMVPMLMLIATQPGPQARGYSLGYMVITALVGFFMYKYKMQLTLDYRAIALLTAGGVCGALLGGWAAEYIPSQYLNKVFALLMVFVAWKLFFKPPEKPEPAPDATASVTIQTSDTATIAPD